MEFIIVFPIYLVLFAATFILGDMLIHSNRLAFGDRVNAFDVDASGAAGAAWNYFTTSCFGFGREVDDNRHGQDDHDASVRDGIYADRKGTVPTGPWTVCAASKVVDKYRPPAGGTLGQLLFGDQFLSEATHSGRDQGMLATWQDPDGRVPMQSMGMTLLFRDEKGMSDLTCYRYVTLKRRILAGNRSGPWRDMTSGLLIGERWRTEVAEDAWHDVASVRARNTQKPSDPGTQELRPYQRYRQFETWSE